MDARGAPLSAAVQTALAAGLAIALVGAPGALPSLALPLVLGLQGLFLGIALPLAARQGRPSDAAIAALLHLLAPLPALLAAAHASDASARSLGEALACQAALAALGGALGRLARLAPLRATALGALLVVGCGLPLASALARRLLLGEPVRGTTAGPAALAALRLRPAEGPPRLPAGATSPHDARADAEADALAGPIASAWSAATSPLGGVYRPGIPAPLALPASLAAAAESANEKLARARQPREARSAPQAPEMGEGPRGIHSRGEGGAAPRGKTGPGAAVARFGREPPFAAIDLSHPPALALLVGGERPPEGPAGAAPLAWRAVGFDVALVLRLGAPSLAVDAGEAGVEVRSPGLPGPLAALRAFDAIDGEASAGLGTGSAGASTAAGAIGAIGAGRPAGAAASAPSDAATLEAARAWIATWRRPRSDPSVDPDLYAIVAPPAPTAPYRRRLAAVAALGFALAAGLVALRRRPRSAAALAAVLAAVALAGAPRGRALSREDAVVALRPGGLTGAEERLVQVSAPVRGEARLVVDHGLLEPVVFERPEPRAYAVVQRGSGSALEGLDLGQGERRLFRRVAPRALAGPIEVVGGGDARQVVNQSGIAFAEALVVDGARTRRLGPLADGAAAALAGPTAPAPRPHSAVALALPADLEGLVARARRSLRGGKGLIFAAPLPEVVGQGPASVEAGWLVVVIGIE